MLFGVVTLFVFLVSELTVSTFVCVRFGGGGIVVVRQIDIHTIKCVLYAMHHSNRFSPIPHLVQKSSSFSREFTDRIISRLMRL